MSDKSLKAETLPELQIWIDGKFDLIAQAQNTAHDDLTNVRRTVHELANQMTVIIALNLPEKLAKLEEADKRHDLNIDKLAKEAAERKGMLTALKTLYVVIGAFVGWITAVVFEFYKG